MKKPRRYSLLCSKLVLATMALVGASQALLADVSARSAGQVVWVNTSQSLQWKTAMDSTIQVAINWPEDAVEAILTVDDGVAAPTVTTLDDVSVSQFPLSVPMPSDAADERVLNLAIDYKDKDGVIVDSQAARIGRVCGVSGGGVRCVSDSSEKSWAKVREPSVLPIPEGTRSLVVDEVQQSPLDVPGWWFWKDVRSSLTHCLVLENAEGEIVADLKTPGGMCIIFR